MPVLPGAIEVTDADVPMALALQDEDPNPGGGGLPAVPLALADGPSPQLFDISSEVATPPRRLQSAQRALAAASVHSGSPEPSQEDVDALRVTLERLDVRSPEEREENSARWLAFHCDYVGHFKADGKGAPMRQCERHYSYIAASKRWQRCSAHFDEATMLPKTCSCKVCVPPLPKPPREPKPRKPRAKKGAGSLQAQEERKSGGDISPGGPR